MSSTLTRASENARLQHVYQTIIEFGENSVADSTWIGRPRRAMQKWIWQVPDVPVLPLPTRTRILLERLGPTYVKLGQIVSSQANVLPDDWKVELDKLQNEVSPVPYDEIRQAIVDELGAPPEELYAEFSEAPLAAASLGQVHVARLHDGRKVAVKVQRPGIQKQVRADLGITRFFGRNAERRSAYARDIGLASMLDEFSSTLLEELDYYAEAYNMTRLAANIGAIEGVHVPDLISELSTDKVLTQEFVSGVKISDVDAIRAAGHDPAALGDAALHATIKMLLIDGFFHADPHPGNLIVDLETGVVTFLDCGMVGEITPIQRAHMVMVLWAYTRGDLGAMADEMRSLSVPFRPVDEEAYRKSFQRRMARFVNNESDITVMFSQGMGVLRDNGLRLDPQLTLAIKSLTQSSAFFTLLAPPGPALRRRRPQGDAGARHGGRERGGGGRGRAQGGDPAGRARAAGGAGVRQGAQRDRRAAQAGQAHRPRRQRLARRPDGCLLQGRAERRPRTAAGRRDDRLRDRGVVAVGEPRSAHRLPVDARRLLRLARDRPAAGAGLPRRVRQGATTDLPRALGPRPVLTPLREAEPGRRRRLAE